MRIFAHSRTVEVAMAASRRNNFDILRFIAAGFVIVSHSFALAGSHAEPFLGSTTLGTFGVYTFFIMSGFLVANSWHLHPRVAAFLGKRILRIVPGLAAATLFVLLIVGPIFTKLSLGQYFTHPLTVAYLGNVSLFTLSYNLPGVFAANAFPSSTNGSIWTLPYEFLAYIGLAMAGAFGLLRRRFNLVLSVLGVMLAMYAFLFIFRSDKLTVLDLQLLYIPRMFAFFVMGVIIFQHRDNIKLWEPYALLAFLAIVASPWLPGQFCIRLVALSYLVIYLALASTKYASSFAKYGDISYGMYIYAWPVQQSVYALTQGQIGPLRMIAFSYPVIIILAALSWHLVEKPFLRFKHIFSVERYPIHSANRRTMPVKSQV